MSNGVTVKQWTYDNAQRHVMAFQPISEAAHMKTANVGSHSATLSTDVGS